LRLLFPVFGIPVDYFFSVLITGSGRVNTKGFVFYFPMIKTKIASAYAEVNPQCLLTNLW